MIFEYSIILHEEKYVKQINTKSGLGNGIVIKEGGGVKAVPLRKNTFFGRFFSDSEALTAIKLKSGGFKALMALPLKKETFFCKIYKMI